MRRDALPENIIYMDTGCDISPNCLPQIDGNGFEVPGTGCPLLRCKFEDDERELRDSRRREIVEARQTTGLTIRALARQYRISPRTVFRYLAAVGRS